jgi:hypothetical protein
VVVTVSRSSTPITFWLREPVVVEFDVLVTFADGDDFSAPHQFSQVCVIADSPIKARLAAEQMVMTPMLGKPAHIQIVGAKVEVRAI